jgi:hypothetical protein
LPTPIVNEDLDKIKIDVNSDMTDEQLVDFLKKGIEIINRPKKLNSSSS